ncbi:MAG: ribosomal protein [Segetibacter sp.]|nr:ribosomal protein [Segetibacter sp.]
MKFQVKCRPGTLNYKLIDMKKIKITQVKSGIDRNETAKRTLIALGLKKLNASVEVEATPQILGMVRRAGHLLKVEEVQAVEAAATA